MTGARQATGRLRKRRLLRARSALAVMIRVAFGGFGGMVVRMQAVAVGDVSVMRAFLVVVLFVMLRGFTMVLGRCLMVLGGFAMMIGDFVVHGISLSGKVFRNVDRVIVRPLPTVTLESKELP